MMKRTKLGESDDDCSIVTYVEFPVGDMCLDGMRLDGMRLDGMRLDVMLERWMDKKEIRFIVNRLEFRE